MVQLLVVILVSLVAMFAYFQSQISALKLVSTPEPYSVTTFYTPTPQNLDISSEVQKAVADALAKIPSPTPVVKTITQTTTTASHGTVYIPLGGQGNTTNTGWVDVPNNEVYINLKGDYGQTAKATWDVFLRVENANGQAFARLFDVTHSIAVDGSEVSIVNNASFTQASSGNLNLWAGKNLYRVQLKSLNGFPIYLDSGRVKISF